MRTDRLITGSVHRRPRQKGSDVWTFFYRDADRKQRSALLGPIDKMTEEQAHRKAHRLRATLFHNRTRMTVRQVIQLYEQEGIPARESTAGPLRSQLKRLDQEFGSLMFDDFLLDIAGVERWLRDLQTTPGIRKDGVVFRPAEPMARKTKAHIKALLHRLGEFAMKHGVLDLQRNPMSLVEVRTGPRRKRTPTILTSEQFWQLLAELEKIDGAQHVVVMAQVAMFLGLRISEVLGLRWEDVDLIGQAINISRSSVGQSIDETKTEGSATDLPLDPALVRVLAAWHGAKPVIGGWLFGSPYTNRPFHSTSVLTKYLKPAARKVGLPRLGWHDFRHTYRAMLRDLKLPLEVQSKLMRHTSITMTARYGDGGMDGAKREANRLLLDHLHTSRDTTARPS